MYGQWHLLLAPKSLDHKRQLHPHLELIEVFVLLPLFEAPLLLQSNLYHRLQTFLGYVWKALNRNRSARNHGASSVRRSIVNLIRQASALLCNKYAHHLG